MFFIIGLPMLQIIVFNLAIGHDPFDLKLAVFNEELNTTFTSESSTNSLDLGRLLDQRCEAPTGCNYTMLSCRYLSFLKNRRILYELYDSAEAAEQHVQSGHVWGSITFAANYSAALFERSAMGRYAEPEALDWSNVDVRLDKSSECYAGINWAKFMGSIFTKSIQIYRPTNQRAAVARSPVRLLRLHR